MLTPIYSAVLQTLQIAASPAPAPGPPPPPPPGDPSITINITATEIVSAPEAILFDASGTTCDIEGVTYPFHELRYEWSFGDSGSGTFATTGRSKNTSIYGPLAAHVYNNPGTYTVSLTVTHVASNTSNYAEYEVVIPDANDVYPGTQTICVAPDSDWAGAPAGASLVTSLSINGWDTNNRRIMLKRGQAGNYGSFSANYNVDNVLVDAFGEGSAPVLTSIGTQGNTPPSANAAQTRLKFRGLHVTGNVGTSLGGNGFMLHQCTMTTGAISIAGTLEYFTGQTGYNFATPKRIFLSEVTMAGTTSSPHVSIYGAYTHGAIIGCQTGQAVEHSIRPFLSYKMVYSENYIPGGAVDAIRHCLKMQGLGLNAYSDNWNDGGINGAFISAQVVVGGNRFGSSGNNNQWITTVGPENSTSAQGTEDIIFDGNDYYNNAGSNSDLNATGRRITARNNTRAAGSSGAFRFTGNMGGYAVPEEFYGPYWVYNNMV